MTCGAKPLRVHESHVCDLCVCRASLTSDPNQEVRYARNA
ncbi:protein NinF [Sinorhizobium medicae]